MSTMTNGRPAPPLTANTSSTTGWTVHDASELYEVPRWSNGYFSVNAEGHVQIHPTKEPSRGIDLKELVDRLQLRGISLPVLIRFTDILKHRLADIHSAFQGAIAQHQYQGGYSCVYPIKVNQQRQVVEEVLDFGRPYKFGLEAGAARRGRSCGQRDAHHLQRVQGRGIHRNRHAGAQDRAQHHSGCREIHRTRPDSRVRGESRCPAADRDARQARGARQRTVA